METPSIFGGNAEVPLIRSFSVPVSVPVSLLLYLLLLLLLLILNASKL
jgi:hypothetical protein